MTDIERELDAAEKQRRRARTEQGRSPAQQTKRSRNRWLAWKRPSKRERSAEQRREIETNS